MKPLLHPVLFALLVTPIVAGCVAPGQPDLLACDETSLIRDAVAHLARLGDATGGGLPYAPGKEPDPKTTAWVLLATAVARRAGHEGGFDPEPHLDYLHAHLVDLPREATPIDSAANNLSLARAAFQSWGKPPQHIPFEDPHHPEVRTLADAWDARYDPETGRYGGRLNEHLFGAFAAWVFDPPGARIDAMGRYVGDPDKNPDLAREGTDAYGRDAWYAGHARSALGPAPENHTLAEGLDRILDARTEQGATKGFADARKPDASSTAAAILGRIASGQQGHEATHQEADTSPRGQQRANGTNKYAEYSDYAAT
ncbi:MAG: hypothetical protein KY455_10875 [Euryarchaeota archaeon]|nr:hypothetical protein [Euryarchaeota archaeon]